MGRSQLSVRRTAPRSGPTRQKVLAAASETVRERGFAGATTSAIAKAAGVNEGTIFYHFGSLTQLFVEVLDLSSSERLAAYQAALEEADGAGAFVAAAVRLFHDDLASGHVTVLTEMAAGASSTEGLRPVLREHVERWISFAEQAVQRHLTPTAMAGMLPPPRRLAVLVVSMYLGAELLSHLAPELGAGDALEDAVQRLAPVASALAEPGAAPGAGHE